MSDWMNLLRDEIGKSSITVVAARLDVSRTAISLVVNEKYPSSTERIASRVLDVFGKVDCPYLNTHIRQSECRGYSVSAIPTSSPRALRHWRACQKCEFRGEKSC